MSKRAVIPIAIILGLIVIALVGYGVVSVGWNYAKEKFFSERGVFGIGGPSESKFVPYTGPAPENRDLIAMDSMNALACAISSVASGNLESCRYGDIAKDASSVGADITGGVVSAFAQETPSCPAAFGQSCVTCRQPTLIGNDKKLSVADIGRMVESCARNSNFADNDMYCGYILGGSIEKEISKSELVDWLKNNARDDVKNAVNTKFKIDINPGPLRAAHGYHVCADDDVTNEIYLYDKVEYDNDCKDMYDKWKADNRGNIHATQCDVYSFELQQKIEKKGFFNPTGWVAGYNDPDYVAYFEAFPRGMEKFWHVDEISMVSVGLILGFAAFDIIPGVKGLTSAMKKGAKEAAEAMATRGIRSAMKEFFESVGKRGWKGAMRKRFIEDIFAGYAHGIDEKIAKEVSGEVDNYLRTAIKNNIPKDRMLKELEDLTVVRLAFSDIPTSPSFLKQYTDEYLVGFGKNLDELTQEELQVIRSEAIDQYRRAVAADLARESVEVYSKKLTKGFARELGRRMAVKKFFREMFQEGLEDINGEAVRTQIRKTLQKFTSLPPEQQKLALETGVQLSEDIIRKDGLLDFAKITGKSFTNPDEATQKLTKQFIDAIAIDEGKTLAEAATRAGLGTLVALKRGSVGPHNPLTQPFKFFGDQIPVSFKYLGLGTAPKAMAWIRDHKYPIIILLAFYAAAEDAADEKFEPVGMNALGLTRPFLRGDAKIFPMHDAVTKYLVVPKDQGGNRRFERLYLASPCKADLQVQTEICECSRTPFGVQHWKFREDTPKVDLQGITLNELVLESDDTLYNYFVKENPDNYVLEMSDSEAVADLLTKIKQKEAESRQLYIKYPQLRDWNPSYDTIKTTKGAVAARERLQAVKFFDDIVNGISLGAVNNEGVLFGFRAEEPKDMIPQKFWDYNEFFYDFTGVQKMCLDRGATSAWVDLVKMNIDIVSGEETSIQNNIYAQPVYKSDCITVGIKRDSNYKTEFGANYCIDEYPYLTVVRWTLFAVEVTASIALTAITGGTAAPFLIATTGIVSGFAEEIIAQNAKWPAYNDEGNKGTVPIVGGKSETTAADAQYEGDIYGL